MWNHRKTILLIVKLWNFGKIAQLYSFLPRLRHIKYPWFSCNINNKNSKWQGLLLQFYKIPPKHKPFGKQFQQCGVLHFENRAIQISYLFDVGIAAWKVCKIWFYITYVYIFYITYVKYDFTVWYFVTWSFNQMCLDEHLWVHNG